MNLALRMACEHVRSFASTALLMSLILGGTLLVADDKSNEPEPLRTQTIVAADNLQDWKHVDGRLESAFEDANRKELALRLLTHYLNPGTGHFAISARVGINSNDPASEEAAMGWLLGDGIFAGVDGAGRAFIRDLTKLNADRGIQVGSAAAGIAPHEVIKDVAIRVLASPDTVDDKLIVVRVSIHDSEADRLFSSTTRTVPTAQAVGNISLVSKSGPTEKGIQVWSRDWEATGSKLNQSLEATAAPTVVAPFRELNVDFADVFQSSNSVCFLLKEDPESHRFEMPRINNPITRTYFSDQPSVDLQLTPEPTTWRIKLPEETHATSRVLVVETVGEPMLVNSRYAIPANDQGTYVLAAHMAVTHGEMLRYEPQPHKNTVGYWTKPADWVQWHLEVKHAGKYSLHILQGCGTGQGGSEVGIHVRLATESEPTADPLPEPTLRFVVQDTGHFQNFVSRELGIVELKTPGHYTLEIRPERLAKNAVMDVRELRLVPTPDR